MPRNLLFSSELLPAFCDFNFSLSTFYAIAILMIFNWPNFRFQKMLKFELFAKKYKKMTNFSKLTIIDNIWMNSTKKPESTLEKPYYFFEQWFKTRQIIFNLGWTKFRRNFNKKLDFEWKSVKNVKNTCKIKFQSKITEFSLNFKVFQKYFQNCTKNTQIAIKKSYFQQKVESKWLQTNPNLFGQ